MKKLIVVLGVLVSSIMNGQEINSPKVHGDTIGYYINLNGGDTLWIVRSIFRDEMCEAQKNGYGYYEFFTEVLAEHYWDVDHNMLSFREVDNFNFTFDYVQFYYKTYDKDGHQHTEKMTLNMKEADKFFKELKKAKEQNNN